MSKKTNTLLFILGATLFNVIVTVACFIILVLLYGKFFFNVLPKSGDAWALPIIFIISIAASFFVYRSLIKLLMKKIDMTKYFAPIFGAARPPRNLK